MRVGRREFARVFPQLSLLGQTWSENCMRVDESLSSFFRFPCFYSLLPRFFSSHYSNCHLSMIRNNIFVFSCSSSG